MDWYKGENVWSTAQNTTPQGKSWRHIHSIWNTNMADLTLGINPIGIFCAWPIMAEVNRYLGNNTVISSLSINRHLNIRIATWSKLGMHTYKATEDKAMEYTGSYFTITKVSSYHLQCLKIPMQNIIIENTTLTEGSPVITFNPMFEKKVQRQKHPGVVSSRRIILKP